MTYIYKSGEKFNGSGYGLSVRKSMCAKIARVAFSLIRILEILFLSYYAFSRSRSHADTAAVHRTCNVRREYRDLKLGGVCGYLYDPCNADQRERERMCYCPRVENRFVPRLWRACRHSAVAYGTQRARFRALVCHKSTTINPHANVNRNGLNRNETAEETCGQSDNVSIVESDV